MAWRERSDSPCPAGAHNLKRVSNWVAVVGYRHEVVHTGVLAAVLRHSELGTSVARAMTGAGVVAVDHVTPETRIEGFSGRADLTAQLTLDDGASVSLGVETKVDSDGSREQLKATAAPPHYGVLLALGLTALKLEQDDLGPDLEQWRVVDPAAWGKLLVAVGAVDHARDLLTPYLGEIEREAREHEAARAVAQSATKPRSLPPTTTRREGGYLEDLAWLAEVRERLTNRHWWWTKTLISGPLMGYWPAEWNDGRTDVYLEFMCFDRSRSLCLKAAAQDPQQLITASQHLLDVAAEYGWHAPRRRAGSRAKSCTAAWLDVTDYLPCRAAELVHEQLAALSGALAIQT
jgi:hypothetical protein